MSGTLLAAGEMGGLVYISGLKLLPVLVLAGPWLWLMTWADKDADNARLPREWTNLINIGLIALSFALLPLMPNVWAAIGLLLLGLATTVAYYLLWRNNTVGLADLKVQIANAFKPKEKEKQVKALEGEVVLTGSGGKAFQPPAEDDPARVGFEALQHLIANPVKLRAERIDLRPIEGGSVQRYTVDGITLEGRHFSRDDASAAVELMKGIAGLDTADRRKPQKGKIKVRGAEANHDVDVQTAGSTAGEMMKLVFDQQKRFSFTVDDLGLLPDQLETVTDTVRDGTGVVIVTAPDEQGQTNLAYALLRKHDAFLSHIQTLERRPATELEGIRHNKLAADAPSGEETRQISWIISQEPDVIFIDHIDDPRTAIDLAKFAKDGKRVYVGMKVANTFDALSQWRKLIGDDELALSSLTLIVAARLIRVLCDACKIGYNPDEAALKKMGMSPEAVSVLYQARKEPMRDQKGNEVVCTFCHGMAYKGRTGVYELFKIDADVAKTVAAGGTPNQLKSLFRKQKQRYLQEAALARVERGHTSVEEVLRVLRSQVQPTPRKAPPVQITK